MPRTDLTRGPCTPLADLGCGSRLGSRLGGLALLGSCLAGCSPYRLGAPPSDPTAVTRPFTAYLDGMASVCVIRTSPIAAAVTFLVYDNEVLAGATRGPTWFCYRAEPGPHDIVISSEDGQQRFSVDLEERGRYYLDQGLTYRLGYVVPRGRWIDESAAAALLASSQHRILQGAPASEPLLIGTDVVGAQQADEQADEKAGDKPDKKTDKKPADR